MTQAIKKIEELHPGIVGNIMLAQGNKVVDLELSGKEVLKLPDHLFIRNTINGIPWALHTNHYLSELGEGSPPPLELSKIREARVLEIMGNHDNVSGSLMATILSDVKHSKYPIYSEQMIIPGRGKAVFCTHATVVMDLDKLQLRVRTDPDGPHFRTINLN